MQSKTYPWVELLLVLAALVAPCARAQNAPPAHPLHAERVQALHTHAAREALRHDVEARDAHAMRARLQLPIQFSNGRSTYALVRTDGGFPVFVQTLAVAEAGFAFATNARSGSAYTGRGVQVAVWDGGTIRRTHQELLGRTTTVDKTAAVQTHATHIGGIVAGSGVDAEARGFAPEAALLSYDWGRDRTEMATAAAAGLRLSNHSYGQSYGWVYNPRNDGRWAWLGNPNDQPDRDVRFGQYDWLAAAWDDIAFDAPHYLIVKAAGNDRGEGPAPGTEHWIIDPVASKWILTTDVRERDGGADGFDTILDAGNGKNVLTVGARGTDRETLANSAWGPTDDGRIKPDLIADGYQQYSSSAANDQSYTVMSGTSMAAASATGAVAQLLELEQTLAPAQPLRAATYRALLLHTADDAGSAPGPDYATGWGALDAQEAEAVLMAGLTGSPRSQIKELSIVRGESTSMRVQASGTEPLRVTIAWTDPAGPAGATAALVNDLDIDIRDEAGQVFLPWVLDPANPAAPAQRGVNTRDNVEQVLIEAPTAGTYTVTVRFADQSSSTLSQSYSIVATGLSESSASLPVELTAFEAIVHADGALLRWETASETNNAGFAVEVRPGGTASWRDVGFVAGHGTTAEAQRYAHVVSGLEAGIHRFRLRQVDFDGATAYSAEVEVDLMHEAPFFVAPPAPNPFAGRVETRFTVARGQHVRADVFDLLGRHVATVFDDFAPAQSPQPVVVEGEAFAPGVYLLVVRGEAFQHTERIVRVH